MASVYHNYQEPCFVQDGLGGHGPRAPLATPMSSGDFQKRLSDFVENDFWRI